MKQREQNEARFDSAESRHQSTESQLVKERPSGRLFGII